MALFPEVSTYYKGRTHTSLVVSEGNAPAEKYLPSASEKVKFQYEFGPEGNQGVVIPKGKIVAAAGLEWDYETEHNVPAIKIAGDGALAAEDEDPDFELQHILGVNHHNVYERRRDRFSGNQPTVITREYIEVPLFSDKAMAAAINFGAAWVTADDNLDAANKMFGKYVTSDAHGNFRLADKSTDIVVGQVLGVETDTPPAGYLQYFMEMDDERWNEFQKQMSYAPSPGRTKNAGYDIGTYPLGSGYLKNKNDLIKHFDQGIPFLTDGYFKAKVDETYALNTEGVEVTVSGDIVVTEDKIKSVDPTGAALFVKLPKKIAMDEVSRIKVMIDTIDVSPANVHVDQANDTIVIYLTAAVEDKAVSLFVPSLEKQIPGIPTGWDFKGAYGAVRILLQK